MRNFFSLCLAVFMASCSSSEKEKEPISGLLYTFSDIGVLTVEYQKRIDLLESDTLLKERFIVYFNENLHQDSLTRVYKELRKPVIEKVALLRPLSLSEVEHSSDISLVSSHRLQLFTELNEILGETAFQVNYIKNGLDEIYQSRLDKAGEDTNKLDKVKRHNERIKLFKSKVETKVNNKKINWYSFVYKSFTDEELMEYITFLKSPLVQYFIDETEAAFDYAYDMSRKGALSVPKE